MKNGAAYLFILVATCITAQQIDNRAKLINPNTYFARVVQETIYEIEKREWCSLKLLDVTDTLNDITHTNLLVTGTANYTNGFLVSIQKIDVNEINSLMTSRNVSNEIVTTATVRGMVNFRDAGLGYDVTAKLTSDGTTRKYTGIFTHTLIQGQFSVMKNMNTGELTVNSRLVSLSGGSGVRMVYMPEDEISEVMSLRFAAGNNWDSIGVWYSDTIVPIMLDVVKHKIAYPSVCFNC